MLLPKKRVNLINSDFFSRIWYHFFIFAKNVKLKQRYFIELAYKGTNFNGWQIQPNANSVQACIERALSTILRDKISVVGAGRTDTGVHAGYFVAHFDSLVHVLDNKDFVHKLNSFLPNDISVFSISKVNSEAHARFNAVSRTYMYFINLTKNPFIQETSWFYFKRPDIEIMNEACKILFEYSDFTSFSKLQTDVKTNNCRIIEANWQNTAEGIVFIVKADRFLRNMVRALVGTILEVGLNKIDLNEFRQIIENKNRNEAGLSVPAHGLFLTDIIYPEDVFVKIANKV